MLEASCYNSDFQIRYDNQYGNEVTDQVTAGTLSETFYKAVRTHQYLNIRPDNNPVNVSLLYVIK